MVDPTTEPYASIERTVDLSDLRVYSSPYAPVWHEDQNGRRGRAVYVVRGAVHVNPENFALLMKDHGRGEPWTVLEIPPLSLNLSFGAPQVERTDDADMIRVPFALRFGIVGIND